MQTYFADTWFWIAVVDRSDRDHKQAFALSMSIGPTDTVVTSEMVCTELLGYFCSDGPHLRAAAVALVDRLKRDLRIVVVEQSHLQFEQALEKYRRFSDKDWSLTDCCSMVIMAERAIDTVLTNDRHFTQAGFSIRNT